MAAGCAATMSTASAICTTNSSTAPITTVSGTDLFSEQDGLWGELGFGGSYNWDDDKYSIYGEGSVMTSLADFGDSYALKGTAGFRIKW